MNVVWTVLFVALPLTSNANSGAVDVGAFLHSSIPSARDDAIVTASEHAWRNSSDAHREVDLSLLESFEALAGAPYVVGTRHAWMILVFLVMVTLMVLLPIFLSDGPTAFIAVVLHLSCLVCVKILVKDVLNSGFNFPYTITAFHMLITAIVASILDPPQLRQAIQVLPIALASGSCICMNNLALSVGNAAFVTLLGACTPFSTYVFEVVKYGTASIDRSVAVIVVCLGAMCAMHGAVAFSTAAFFFSVTANFCRSGKLVWQHDLLLINLSPYCIVAWIGIWTFAALTPMVAYLEGKAAFSTFFVLPFKVQLGIAASGAVASMLNVCQCVALKSLAPLLQNAVGNLQVVLMLALSTAWLHEVVTLYQWLGAALIIAGCALTKLTAPPSLAQQKTDQTKLSGAQESSTWYGALLGSQPKRSADI